MKDSYILNCGPSDKNGTDWVYPVGAAPSELPENFSRRKFTRNVSNQGTVGSCVGQTLSVVFNDTTQCESVSLSPMWIYKRAKRHDYWAGEDYSGTSISGACLALKKEGACKEEFYPYHGSTEDYEPLTGAIADADRRKVIAFYNLAVHRIDEIKNLLLKESLACSIAVHSGFYAAKDDGIVVEAGYEASKYQGGHAMAIVGWKVIDGILHWEFQNSWGDNWGDDGFCFIPHTLLENIKSSNVYYLVTENEDNVRIEKEKRKRSKLMSIIAYVPELLVEGMRYCITYIKNKFS